MSTLGLLVVCITSIVVISCIVYVMYLLDEAGVFDSATDKMVHWLDKEDTASKWE